MRTIADKVSHFIQTDEDFNIKNHAKIVMLYNQAPTHCQIVINNIFINLCGYSLNTMINKMYRYSDLDRSGREQAWLDYQRGWNVTHPEEYFTALELDGFCRDLEDELFYDAEGNCQEDIS
jgi:hypothetical protein